MKKIAQGVVQFASENRMVLVVTALAIAIGTFLCYEEYTTLQGLAPKHRAQIEKYDEIVRTAQIGEFVTFVPRDSGHDKQKPAETWIVIERMFNPNRIKLQGPGPDSNPNQRTVVLTSVLHSTLSFLEGEATGYPVREISILRNTQVGFQEYGRFHFLQ